MKKEVQTGYPSIDKPWLKYYSKEAIKAVFPQMSAYDYLVQNNCTHLADTALIYFDKELSYGQLFKEINRAANAFQTIGVDKGEIVTICATTVPETIISIYALNKIGAIVDMYDPRKGIVADTGSKVLIVLDILSEMAEKYLLDDTSFEHVIILSMKDSMTASAKMVYNFKMRGKSRQTINSGIRWKEFLDRAQKCEIDDEKSAERGDGAAAIVHTGGTTGTPKCVLLSNNNFNALAHQYRYLGLDYNRKQKFLDIMPIFIAYGLLWGIHMPLSLGITIILIPIFTLNELDSLIIKYHPEHFAGVPMHYIQLLNSVRLKKYDLSFIKNPAVGGDNLNKNDESRINSFLESNGCKKTIAKGYGLTEASSAISACCENCNSLGSVGIPLIGNVISIFKPNTDIELTYYEEGEVCVIGPTNMIEYFKNPEETQEIFKRHKDGKKWLHTGDLGYMTEDGQLYIIDRIKRMYIRAEGYKIFAKKIEMIIEKCDAVGRCVIVGIPDPNHTQGQVPKACIILDEKYCGDKKTAVAEITKFCQDNLVERDFPEEIVLYSDFPLTAIGKVDYRALEKEL